MGVERVELYENGTLIESWDVDPDGGDFSESLAIAPAQDSWYVVIALGEGTLWPLFTPVEMPSVQLEDVVTSAVAAVLDDTSLLGTPIHMPRHGPVMPYALTNPIWIDLAGDGFDAPGVPSWLVEPVDPADLEEEEEE